MKRYITGDTVANTVRMAASWKRPRAVFLASDDTDLDLLQTLLTSRNFRVVHAHNRANAAKAFELLVKTGYDGVFTAINTHFAPSTAVEAIGERDDPSEQCADLEGEWEEIQRHGMMLTGRTVRVTVVADPEDIRRHQPQGDSKNTAMLEALAAIDEIMVPVAPKSDRTNYLKEAREGAMYGFGFDK